MARAVVKSNVESLPPPSNVFARWVGVIVTSSWALGVQSFPDRYNKVFSVLSPGAGYIAGHTLQYGIISANAFSSWVGRKRALSATKRSIKALQSELALAKRTGAEQSVVLLIEELISKAHKKRVEIIAFPITE